MTCRRHQDAILDLARGVLMPAAVEDAARVHLETCSACAAELARQRDVTQALRTLSAQVELCEAPSRLEDRLLAAFPTRLPAVSEAAGGTSGWRWWLGAAAAAALMAGGVWTLRTPSTSSSIERPASVSGSPVAPSGGTPQSAANLPAATERPAPTTQPVRAARKPARAAPRAPRPVRDMEFMTIPAAAGLPPIESATIVRTELPLSALPEYGVQILPDAAHAAIKADLLVGQDGLARGIRLVTGQDGPSASRSRQ